MLRAALFLLATAVLLGAVLLVVPPGRDPDVLAARPEAQPQPRVTPEFTPILLSPIGVGDVPMPAADGPEAGGPVDLGADDPWPGDAAPVAGDTAPLGEDLEDPDDVGLCPRVGGHAPVLRRGIDVDGWPTWWHADGSITKRVLQRAVWPDGSEQALPRILTLTPGQTRPAADAPR